MDMDDLQSIQEEVVRLEQTIYAMLERLQNFQEKLKKIQVPECDLDIDLDMEGIEHISRTNPFPGHSFYMNSEVVKGYILALLYIICVDKNSKANRERLIFICCLRKRTELGGSLKDLIKDAYQMKVNQYVQLNKALGPSLRELFLVDVLLVSNLCGAASLEVLRYISILAAVLNIDQKEMEVLAAVSRWILCRNAGSVKSGLREEAERVLARPEFFSYKEYIEIEETQAVPSKTVRKKRYRGVHQHKRTLLLRVPVCDGFVWNKPAGEYVGYGTMIAKYPNYHWIKADACPEPQEETDRYVLIYSTGSGILFQYTNQGYNYGVASDKDDSLEAIREWVENNGG